MNTLLESVKLHRNPLFIRSAKTRLRRRALLGVGAVTLTIAAWTFSVTYFSASNVDGVDLRAAGRAAFVPMFVIQGLIMILLGTGSVAHGIASDKERGVLDYQRLTPMAPRDKILGDLFGYPVREYYMFALTVPFVVFAAFVGGISALGLLKLYMAFFSSVALYHMTGLVAGMVSRRPRMASWLSRGMVIMLYLILPQVAHLGFGIFSYLTIYPTLNELAMTELSGVVEAVGRGGWQRQPEAPFFGMSLPPLLFTLLLQGSLLWLFSSVMLRKWRHDVNPALARHGALIASALLHILIIGSLWSSLTDPSHLQSTLFPSDEEMVDMAAMPEQLMTTPMEIIHQFASRFLGVALMVYFMLALVSGVLVLHIVTPNPDGMREGMRRAQKAGRTRLRAWHDGASSAWVPLALGGISIAGFFSLLAMAGGNALFTKFTPTFVASLAPALVLLLHLVIAQSAQARHGSGGLGMVIFFLWIVPGLLMLLAVSIFGESAIPAYFATPSPIAGEFFAVYNLFNDRRLDGHEGMLSGLSVAWALLFAAYGVRAQHQQQRAFGVSG